MTTPRRTKTTHEVGLLSGTTCFRKLRKHPRDLILAIRCLCRPTPAALALARALSLPLTLPNSHTLSLTSTHTHTLSLSRPLSLPVSLSPSIPLALTRHTYDTNCDACTLTHSHNPGLVWGECVRGRPHMYRGNFCGRYGVGARR